MKKWVLLFLLILSISFVYAADFPQWKDKYVNDFGGVLSSQQSSELRSLFAGVDSDTSAEVVFVSANECTSYGGPSQYAIDLLNYWKVGKSDKNNGLLILYCVQEKKIFATTGYGLEGILPDSKIGRFLDDNYVPLRDSGNVSQGIVAFSQAISQVIEDNKAEVLSGNAGGISLRTNFKIVIMFLIFGFIIFVFIMLVKLVNKNNKKEPLYIGVKGNYLFEILSFFISGIIAGVLFFILLYILEEVSFIIAFISFFAINKFLLKWRGVRCEKDGLKMKKAEKDGKYQKYKCPNGHIGQILIASAATAGFSGIGLGHGGGGGFGGGGFGGGGGGGGGAGR